MDEAEVQAFWQAHPCGDEQVGSVARAFRGDYQQFFKRYDTFRYRRERHILSCLDSINFRGVKLLEIGLGQGADSEQLIRRGARWSGLDLTEESVRRMHVRLELHRLPYDELKQGSALAIPYPDNLFDKVFSHGVLHHVPNIRVAQREIARVLKPDGELIMMVYAKWSFNYLVAIGLLRRLGLLALYGLNISPAGVYGDHMANARRMGLRNYLKLSNFIHRNTDGPHNPYSKVYGLREVRQDFSAFQVTRAYKRWMHGPPLPVSWLPFGSFIGWHLWVHLRPIKLAH